MCEKAAEAAFTRVESLFFELNPAKSASKVVSRTGGEEELVLGAAVGIASAELDAPELIDMDGFAVRVFDRPDKLPTLNVVAVDGAAICIVRDQQSVAERSEVLGRHGKSPWLGQGIAGHELAHKGSVFVINVDKAGRAFVHGRERDVEQAIDVLNTERGIARGKSRVGKRGHEVKASVKYVHLVIGNVGRVKKISRGVTRNCEGGVNGARGRVIHGDDRVIEIRLRRPSADGAIESGEQKEGRPSLHGKVRGTVEDNPCRLTGAGAGQPTGIVFRSEEHTS